MSPSSARSVLFDLDDTLYREVDFVDAAMRNVASFVGRRTNMDMAAIVEELLGILNEYGRGHVFDVFLERHGLPTIWIPSMLYTYRRTQPHLQLHEDAIPLLEELRERGIRTGIVTDGNALVQRSKVDALDLEHLVDSVVLTDAIGSGAGKPSTTGFVVALELLRCQPHRSVYVANDLNKDFVAPRKLGMTGILVTRGLLGTPQDTPTGGQPDQRVEDLSEARNVIAQLHSDPTG